MCLSFMIMGSWRFSYELLCNCSGACVLWRVCALVCVWVRVRNDSRRIYWVVFCCDMFHMSKIRRLQLPLMGDLYTLSCMCQLYIMHVYRQRIHTQIIVVQLNVLNIN